jgi:hypothetical protein
MNLPSTPRRWALWAGLSGGFVPAAVTLYQVDLSADAQAALVYLVVPFIFIAGALVMGIWGLATGTVVAHLRGSAQAMRPVLAMAWVVAVAVPAVIAWNLAYGLGLTYAVRSAQALDGPALSAAFDGSPWRRDKFFLGALARNPAASSELLARIAGLEDPGLHEAMGSFWDVTPADCKACAVMLLVAKNPNADTATLKRLSVSPKDAVVREALAARNATLEVIQPFLATREPALEHALARNQNTPRDKLAQLAGSDRAWIRGEVAKNRNTPDEALERLAKDSFADVAGDAAKALASRGKGR